MDKNQAVKIDLELFVPGHPFTEKVSALNFEFVRLIKILFILFIYSIYLSYLFILKIYPIYSSYLFVPFIYSTYFSLKIDHRGLSYSSTCAPMG